ncbi:MAG: T9SS type A sorting domain-containing protein [Bacteroidia bacterium]
MLKAEAVNLAGQAVNLVKTGANTWELEQKIQGVYFVTITDESGVRVTQKLVIN